MGNDILFSQLFVLIDRVLSAASSGCPWLYWMKLAPSKPSISARLCFDVCKLPEEVLDSKKRSSVGEKAELHVPQMQSCLDIFPSAHFLRKVQTKWKGSISELWQQNCNTAFTAPCQIWGVLSEILCRMHFFQPGCFLTSQSLLGSEAVLTHLASSSSN